MAIYQVDVFTDKPFVGGPAAVILKNNYTNETKQNIARELNLPVSVFISKSEKADYKLEFYTPKKEIPFSGHATLAAFWILAELGKIKPENSNKLVTQENKLGIFNVDIIWKNNVLDKVYMTLDKFTSTEIDIDSSKLADALGIRSDKIENNEKLPIVLADAGSPNLLILISSKEMVDALVPKFDEVERLCRRYKADGIHLYTFDTYIEGSDCYTRHFEPFRGAAESPASALANGALGAFLVAKGVVSSNKLVIEEGEALERACVIEVEVKMKNSVVESVKVGGKAKTVFEISTKNFF
ncbi:MAG: PhzF family phenazine biosynthesis protein [Asgard group archaeon]|nr:PhzF family phenazine biosynthesis protein [Asgard group archaeon]